jgi:hypothetical protein
MIIFVHNLKFMNCFRLLTFIASVAGIVSVSCTKTETIIKTEVKTDTLEVAAKDTILAMDVAGWEYFVNPGTLPAGPTTYMNTTEGIKVIPQTPRAGIRLQAKSEVGFKDKTIFIKWKVNGGGQFTDIVPSIKYVPVVGDGTPAIQGVDLDSYSVVQSVNGSTLVQSDTWYFTRVAAQKGTNNFQVITASGNYDNKGGTQISTKTIAIYTKHGYPAIRIGEPFAGANAYIVLGEWTIAEN